MRLCPLSPRLKLRLLGAPVAVLAAALAGAPVRAETLAEAAALAYESNPGILATRAQVRALNEAYVQARAGLGMRLNAEVDGAYETLDVPSRNTTVSKTSGTETLALSQPIFSGGRTLTAIQASEADVRAGRERLRQAESDLLQRVVNAYVAVRRDQQVLQVVRASVEVLRQQLEETRAKTEVKENTRTDLAQAEARLAAAQAQAFQSEAQLATSRATYLNAVGQNPGDLAPEPDLPGLPTDIDKAFDAAEAGNMTLLAAKYAEVASRARVALARSQNLPTVTLRVYGGSAPSADYQPRPYLNSITAQAVITQPLFTAGINGSQIRRAIELNNSDRLSIDATRRNVVQSLSQQWSLLSSARASLQADESNVASSETAFFGMRQEERFGLRSTIELLNAQQELTSAQIGFLRDRYNEYTSRVGVMSLTGQLTIELLSPGTKAYDPVPDFDRVKNKGALPTEHVVRALESIVAPGPGKPLAARETAVPDQQLPLPPAPPPALSQRPLRPVTELMKETQNLGRD